MTFLLVAKSRTKDSLTFKGRFNNHVVTEVLLNNRCVEEGKNYAVKFSDYEVVGTTMLVNVTEMKEI